MATQQEAEQYMGSIGMDSTGGNWGSEEHKQASIEALWSNVPTEASEETRYLLSYSGPETDGRANQEFTTHEDMQTFIKEQLLGSSETIHNAAVVAFNEQGERVGESMIFGNPARIKQALTDISQTTEAQMPEVLSHHAGGSLQDAEARLAAFNNLSPAEQEKLMDANLGGANILMEHVMAAGGVGEAIKAAQKGGLDALMQQHQVDAYTPPAPGTPEQSASLTPGMGPPIASIPAGVGTTTTEAPSHAQAIENSMGGVDPADFPTFDYAHADPGEITPGAGGMAPRQTGIEI